MGPPIALGTTSVRALAPADLAGVVAIDASIQGRSRRGYIERRLQAALREPALHAQFAAIDERGIAGYLLARVLAGEFGEGERKLRIELVGTRGELRGHGIGTRLFDALSTWSGRHAISAHAHAGVVARPPHARLARPARLLAGAGTGARVRHRYRAVEPGAR